jgi:ferredoxin-like protein FixX
MCGLVGWISGEKASDALDRRKFIDQALILDTVRGGDSSGVFVVENSWKPDQAPFADWRKQCSGGHEFVISDGYKGLFDYGKTMDYKYCVGHNRSATVGGVVLDAAHPFTEGPITLVHNGTVKKEYTSEKELANDSHGICWKLSKESPETVIKELDGAFALIWHDARDDSLNFVRNAQRPFHMAKSAGNDTIYFASEAEMLYWLDRRLVLKLQDIVQLKPAHWLKFTPPKLMVPIVKEVELFVPKASSQGIGYHHQQWSGTGANVSGYPRNSTSRNTTSTTHTTSTTTKKRHGKGVTYVYNHPEKLQEDLLEYGLFIDQPEEFIPLASQLFNWHGIGNEDSSVIGWLMPEDKAYNPIPAVIHGLNPHTFHMSRGQVWSVIPMGINMLSWTLPMVTCRLKSTTDMYGNTRAIPPNAEPKPINLSTPYIKYATYQKPIETVESPWQRDDDEDKIPYPGPGARSYTRQEGLRATADGCMDCGTALIVEADAFSLEWIATDTGIRPMCSDCIKERMEADEQNCVEEGLKIDPEGL